MAAKDGKEAWLKNTNRRAHGTAAAAKAGPRSGGGEKPGRCARTSKNARTKRAKEPTPATPVTASKDRTAAGVDGICPLLASPSALESAGSML